VWNGYLLRRLGPRFSKCTLCNRGVAQSLSGLCVPVEIDSVEVSRQGDDPCWCGVWREVCCTSSAFREISSCVLRSCEHVVVV